MLSIATTMYLMIPSESNERVLHLGKVLECSPTDFSAEFEEPIAPEVGAELIAFAEMRGKFFQQGAVVIETKVPGTKPVILLSRVGDVVNAEQRQMFRVSVVTTDMEARIGNEKHCKVVDLSAEGFGAVAETELSLGSLVNVAVAYEGQTAFSTTARVQTVKLRHDGKFRYGFLAPDKNSIARKAMQQLSSTIQRMQLRRLSGAA